MLAKYSFIIVSVKEEFLKRSLSNPETSSTMRALSSARCTDVRLKESYQLTSARRALALLNSPQVSI